MTYSLDLRKRVVNYVRSGNPQTEASRFFDVDRKTIYSWLNRETLSAKPHGTRRRKLDSTELAAHVRDNPDALLRERAAHFNVSTSSIWSALKKMNIVKKND